MPKGNSVDVNPLVVVIHFGKSSNNTLGQGIKGGDVAGEFFHDKPTHEASALDINI